MNAVSVGGCKFWLFVFWIGIGSAWALSDGEIRGLVACQRAWGSSAPSDWQGAPNCETWSGLTCDENGLLMSLIISGFGLIGQIPSEIGLFSNLLSL